MTKLINTYSSMYSLFSAQKLLLLLSFFVFLSLSLIILADVTNGRAYATVLCPSVVCITYQYCG